jgi:hypothetical protein
VTFEVSVGGDGSRAGGTEGGALCACCSVVLDILDVVVVDVVVGDVVIVVELPTAEFATAAANPTIVSSFIFSSPILLEISDVGAAGRAGGAMLQLLAMN